MVRLRQAATEQTVQPTITGVDTDAPASRYRCSSAKCSDGRQYHEGNSSRLLKGAYRFVRHGHRYPRRNHPSTPDWSKYPVAVNKPDEKYRLLSQRPTGLLHRLSGLLGPKPTVPHQPTKRFSLPAQAPLKDGEDTSISIC